MLHKFCHAKNPTTQQGPRQRGAEGALFPQKFEASEKKIEREICRPNINVSPNKIKILTRALQSAP